MPKDKPSSRPSAVAGVLRRPFREQVAYFRQKLGRLVPTRRWDDMTGAAHDTGFMVAGAQKADLLADLAASVDRAIAEGKSLDAFRKDFDAAVERHDWHGWTGEETKAGRAWRTRTIYNTNTYVAYAAGRFAQLTAEKWKYWIYKHGGSEEPRPEHLHVFDGLMLPPDHPFWQKFYPPSDWGCSCYVVGANDLALARLMGGDPDKTLPDGWDKPDPATGEPAGIGKGWGYAPGASVAGPVAAMAEKVRHWDHRIGKAFLEQLPPSAADAIAGAYRRLPSVADDARRYARRVLGEAGDAHVQPFWTLGRITTDQAAVVNAIGPAENVGGYDLSLSPSDILHIARRHGDATAEAAQGQLPVSAESYGLLPTIVSSPDTIEDGGRSEIGEALIRYVKRIGTAVYVAVFAIRAGRRTLGLKTLYIRKE